MRNNTTRFEEDDFLMKVIEEKTQEIEKAIFTMEKIEDFKQRNSERIIQKIKKTLSKVVEVFDSLRLVLILVLILVINWT